jgi:hypothetical protein
MKFILEDAFEGGKLIPALNNLGIPYDEVSYINLISGLYAPEPPSFVFSGLRFASHFKHNFKKSLPGVLDAGEMGKYYWIRENLPGKYLLNGYGITGKFENVFGNMLALWKAFGPLFVRPMDSYKSFPGLSVETEEKAREAVLFLDTPHNKGQDCFVAPYQEIEAEYRFWVFSGNIWTASRYFLKGEISECQEVPEEAERFANEVLTTIYIGGRPPESAYTLDIALLKEKQWKVVEINGISSAGLYACDPAMVVEGVLSVCSKT